MKTIHTLSAKADELNLSGNILTINGKDYDLENPPVKPVLFEDGSNQDEVTAFNSPVYKDGDTVYLHLHYDTLRQWDFLGSHLMDVWDLDQNGDISVTELENFIDKMWNASEEERRDYRKERIQ